MTEQLTAVDLIDALEDERHHGFGYATRRSVPYFRLLELDREVIRQANTHQFTKEELFEWTNSKLGRWLVDEIVGCGTPIEEAVPKYLSRANLESLH